MLARTGPASGAARTGTRHAPAPTSTDPGECAVALPGSDYDLPSKHASNLTQHRNISRSQRNLAPHNRCSALPLAGTALGQGPCMQANEGIDTVEEQLLSKNPHSSNIGRSDHRRSLDQAPISRRPAQRLSSSCGSNTTLVRTEHLPSYHHYHLLHHEIPSTYSTLQHHRTLHHPPSTPVTIMSDNVSSFAHLARIFLEPRRSQEFSFTAESVLNKFLSGGSKSSNLGWHPAAAYPANVNIFSLPGVCNALNEYEAEFARMSTRTWTSLTTSGASSIARRLQKQSQGTGKSQPQQHGNDFDDETASSHTSSRSLKHLRSDEQMSAEATSATTTDDEGIDGDHSCTRNDSSISVGYKSLKHVVERRPSAIPVRNASLFYRNDSSCTTKARFDIRALLRMPVTTTSIHMPAPCRGPTTASASVVEKVTITRRSGIPRLAGRSFRAAALVVA
ncbi:hypothetical protein V8E36_008994 [Tilletia maclaganii]